MSVVREGFGIGGAGVDGSYAAGVMVLLRASRACSQRGGSVGRACCACCWCCGSVAGGPPALPGCCVVGGLPALPVGVSVGAGHARDCGFAASKALLSLN